MMFVSGIVILPVNAQNQNIDTAYFHVHGVCDMCKERIEHAATLRGVKKVNWHKESGMAELIFRIDKVSVEDVRNSIAEAGHDTGPYKANDESYKDLPGCCAYRSGMEKH